MNNMKIKFIEFLDTVKESLENPVDLNFHKKTNENWLGSFIVEEDEYEFSIKRIDSENILIEDKVFYCNFSLLRDSQKIFSLNKQIKKGDEEYDTGDVKRSLRVFATIKKLITDFIDELNPNCLFFYSSDQIESRIYTEFCHYIKISYKEYDNIIYDKFDLPLFMIYKTTYNIMKLTKDIIKFLQIKREM